MTELNTFVNELFLLLNISDFTLLFMKLQPPPPPPPTPLPLYLPLSATPLKIEILSSPSFFKIWSEAQTPSPPSPPPSQSGKGGGAYYDNHIYLNDILKRHFVKTFQILNHA